MKPDKWLELSESALLANVAEVRAKLHPASALGVVLKANAYGHGLAEIAAILEQDDDVDVFCVVNMDEAARLRELGLRKRIVMIGHFAPEAAEAVVELGVIPFVYTSDSLLSLESAASKINTFVSVIMKTDTGMGRLGVRPRDVGDFLAVLQSETTHLKLAGFATHFAGSDLEDQSSLEAQKRLFDGIISANSDILPNDSLNTASNSAGILSRGDVHYDLARLGISLYGLYPSPHTAAATSVALRPVLEFKTRIIHIQNLHKGESVSYGSTWTADSAARIAVLPIGYSDGYKRCYSKGAGVLVKGRFSPIRGRVCMNFTMCDVTSLPNVDLGEEVTLISADVTSGCCADDLARIADTSNYEVTTTLPERLKRIVVSNSD